MFKYGQPQPVALDYAHDLEFRPEASHSREAWCKAFLSDRFSLDLWIRIVSSVLQNDEPL